MSPKQSFGGLKKFLMTLIVVVYLDSAVIDHVSSEKIGIGVVFDQNTEEIQNAFKFAMVQHTSLNSSRRLDFQAYVDIINTADAFKLSRLICNQFARGVWSMLGAVTPDSFDTLHSYTNTFQMPFVTPWFPEKVKSPSSGLIDHAVSLRPDYHRAVIDTITYYGWKNVIYMYDSHDGHGLSMCYISSGFMETLRAKKEKSKDATLDVVVCVLDHGLLRLQQLYTSLQPGNATFRISHVKRVGNATDAILFLRALEKLDRWSNKYVVLDSTTRLAKDILISHVRDVQLGRRNYHYFLSGLVMDDRWEKEVTEFGAINVTGFRVVDVSRKLVREFIEIWKREHRTETISAQAALMYDGVQVLIDSLIRLQRKKPDIFRGSMRRAASQGNSSKLIDCNPTKGKVAPFEHGDKISRLIKKTEIEGLTGNIRFNEDGHRHNFTLQVVEMNMEGNMEKVAIWYDYKGLVPVVAKLQPINYHGTFERNRTYVVTTILETPYLMSRAPDYTEVKTNDAYNGFCSDLVELLSHKLEIKYEIRLVKDGKYGSENPKMVGGWDGMIGEILRKEADMAIAPLTVTLERERVVDFSKPFLSLDLKPTKKSVKRNGSIFSFLQPLSKEIWLCIVFSLFAVSVVLFLVSRFSPCEWRLVSFTETQPSEHNEVATTKTTVVNEFSFWNSMWFSLGSFMQQGSDITPRSVSGRIVGTVWWFFTLIVISFYTANLASHLTVERISEPLHMFGKITACSDDASDGQHGVTTAPLDRTDEDQNWLSMLFDRASGADVTDEKKQCEMVISLSNSGVKDFAVAFPKQSTLREGVNLALQSSKDNGELQKLINKWFKRSDCDNLFDQSLQGSELTLSQVAGIFYVLVGGLALALGVALFEFCQHGRAEAARANVPLRAALRAKAHLASRADCKSPSQRTPQRDSDRHGWNGAFAGFYTPANQIGQEETALHASFTQV